MCTLDGCGTQDNLPPIRVTETDRRAFLAGMISLPLATVLAYPEFAAAQAATVTSIEIPTPGRKTPGAIAMPAQTPAPAVLLIHEWWGLNDQIKAVAAEFAKLGYIAFAIDLYDGKVAKTRDEARALTQGLDKGEAAAHLTAAVRYLKQHESGNGKIGTIGWCFGGGWSLNISTVEDVDATVIYYGRVTLKSSMLKGLKGPVMGHFGTKDRSINKEMVSGFEAEMKKSGKADTLAVHWYEADHAFANPTGSRYDAEDAALAWKRTMEFFEKNLKG